MTILINIALCLAIVCMVIALPTIFLETNKHIAEYIEWLRRNL